MKSEEARHILDSYQPRSPVEDSPEYQEAIKAAQSDPELKAWWEARKKLDVRVQSAIGTIEVPGGLDGKLMSGVLTQVATESKSEKGMSIETAGSFGSTVAAERRRRRLMVLSAAAALLLIAGFLVKYLLFPPAIEFEQGEFTSIDKFRDDMAYYANNRFVLDYTTGDLKEAREWLKQRKAPVYQDIPAKIVQFEGLGCKSFDWGNSKVGLVCFYNGDHEIVHLFIIKKDRFKNLTSPATPLQKMLVQRNLETGGWEDDDYVYCLVGAEPEIKIGPLLPD